MFWTVLPEWYGDTAIVMGCGPSLSRVPQGLHERARVIATNDSYLREPRADVLYSGDRRWWERNYDRAEEMFQGRFMVSLEIFIGRVHVLRNSGECGLDEDPGALRHGSNSGYQAIHLAYHFGATRILLVGFDMHCSGDRVHWKPRDRDNVMAQERVMRNAMLPKFETLREPLERAGVTVINCTPDSSLRTWPYLPLDEALSS